MDVGTCLERGRYCFLILWLHAPPMLTHSFSSSLEVVTIAVIFGVGEWLLWILPLNMVTNSCEFLLGSHGRKGKLHCRLQSQICIQSWKMDTVHYGNWEGRTLHAEACKLARRKEILLKEFWASYRSSQFMNMCWSCLFIGLRYVRSYQNNMTKSWRHSRNI